MATVLDRPTQGAPAPLPPSRPAPKARVTTVGWVQWFVAALLVGAAAVHLALAPSHFGHSTAEGVAFLIAAWFQLALAVAVLLRPTRRIIAAIIAVSVACIGVWVVSRIGGFSFGEHAADSDTVTVVDALTVVMEAFTIVLAAMLLSPVVRRSRSRAYAIVAVASVLALTSALIAAPESRGGSTAATVSATGSGSAGAAASSSASAHVHDHGATTVTDLNGHVVEGVKAHDVAAEQQPDKLLDAATRAQLADQLTAARAAAMQFPTVADAQAGGYFLVGGGYGPGAGAHYISFRGVFGGFDPAKPPTLIYDGTKPTSKIVGLMYLGMGANGTAPEGFAGPNDHWHRHSGVCTKGADVIFPVDADVTEAQCSAKGGRYMATTTWMVHAWVVPGWESSLGVFSHENPNLPCADGTFNTDKLGRCTGPGDVG
jgi:hypothetical protein